VDASPALIAIVHGAFRMEENIRKLTGAPCRLLPPSFPLPSVPSLPTQLPLSADGNSPDGSAGVLTGPFAKMGKCKVRFPAGSAVAVGGLVEIDISSIG
jgi:hypothetical protein